MPILSPKPPSDTTLFLRQVSIAVMIPAILMFSPIVGWFLGQWVGGLFGYPRPGALVGVVMGFISGAMETVRLVRLLNKQLK